jgi:hypothetical protein
MHGRGMGARSYCIKPAFVLNVNDQCQFAACDAQGSIHYFETGYSTALSDSRLIWRAGHRANVNGQLYLSGAMTWQFDGLNVVENGFLHTPGCNDTDVNTDGGATNSFIAQGTSGGTGLTILGDYRYRIYYEYTDYLNRRVQSGFPYDFGWDLTGSNNQITITIPTLQWTRRGGDSVRIAVYRTVAGGTEFFRVDSVRNNPSAASVTVIDAIQDSVLTNNEFDYQNSGELDNRPFPPTYAMASAQDRLFGVSAEQPRRVIYSKPLDGDGAIEFNDNLYIEFPEALTAIATFGSTVYAFAESTVYAFSGEGPDAAGATGGFSAPTVVARNVGCELPFDVGETPIGVVFVGDQGVWLANPDGGVKFIGDVITREGATSVTALRVRSIIALPDTSRVRIIARDISSSVCLDWDYEFNQWSAHTFAETTLADAALVNGAYYIVNRSTGIHKFTSRPDTAVFTDNGTAVAMVAKTAWIRPTGSTIANSHATHGYLLGRDCGHGHSVTIEVARDYDETFTTVGTFAATLFPQIRFKLPCKLIAFLD